MQYSVIRSTVLTQYSVSAFLNLSTLLWSTHPSLPASSYRKLCKPSNLSALVHYKQALSVARVPVQSVLAYVWLRSTYTVYSLYAIHHNYAQAGGAGSVLLRCTWALHGSSSMVRSTTRQRAC